MKAFNRKDRGGVAEVAEMFMSDGFLSLGDSTCRVGLFWPRIQPFRKTPKGQSSQFLYEDSFAGSPPRGGIVDELCGVEDITQAATVSA